MNNNGGKRRETGRTGRHVLWGRRNERGSSRGYRQDGEHMYPLWCTRPLCLTLTCYLQIEKEEVKSNSIVRWKRRKS